MKFPYENFFVQVLFTSFAPFFQKLIMEIISKISDLQARIVAYRAAGKQIGPRSHDGSTA